MLVMLKLACKCEELSLVLERLSTPRLYPSPLAVLNNLSVAMFNFFAIPACERFLSARYHHSQTAAASNCMPTVCLT